MAGTTGFHLDQNFICCGMRAFHFLDRERLLEIVQDSCFHLPLALQEWGEQTGPGANHGLTPRRKNSTALSTRSVSLWGPVRSTVHWRTMVWYRASMNSARCTTGNTL